MKTTTRILTSLMYTTPKRSLLYVTDVAHLSTKSPVPTRRFEHLSCFLPGLLALGVHTLPESAFRLPKGLPRDVTWELNHYNLRDLHMMAATGLAESCWLMYADEPTGLGPEEVMMRQGITWLEDLKRWREKGAPGRPVPGVEEKNPVLKEGIETREYVVKRRECVLRPEVFPVSHYLI